LVLNNTDLLLIKSLFKVEKKLVILGAFIGAMFAIWIAFDKFLVINNRPVLVDGNIEPSYPSTHIMIVTFTLLSSCFYINKNKNIYWGAILCIALCFIFRLLSGMHWVSDCIGGILAGFILYYGYLYTCEKISTEKRE
jgi:undecaprenyl-diphosphatase